MKKIIQDVEFFSAIINIFVLDDFCQLVTSQSHQGRGNLS